MSFHLVVISWMKGRVMPERIPVASEGVKTSSPCTQKMLRRLPTRSPRSFKQHGIRLKSRDRASSSANKFRASRSA